MKKIHILAVAILFFTGIFSVNAQIKSPLLNEEMKKNLEESAGSSSVLDASFKARQNAIILGVDQALIAIEESKKQINSSVNLTNEQKQELLKVISEFEKMLETYKNSVSKAQNSEELMNATKTFLQTLKENKDLLKEGIAKAITISIEVMLKEGDELIAGAKEISEALKLCGVNTSELDKMIADAEKELNELDKLYKEIMADGKVTKDDIDSAKKALIIGKNLSVLTAKISEEMLLQSEKCAEVADYYLSKIPGV